MFFFGHFFDSQNNNNNNALIQEPYTEKMFRQQVASFSSKKIDIILGLITREQNNKLLADGVSNSWIQKAEQLFFLLDNDGKGFVGIDGYFFFLCFFFSSFLLIFIV